jgi:anti-sigma regulatory factor (Ser/Thr protein kinase)
MLRRRSVRFRIIVLVLVPVLALIGLYATVLALTLGSVAALRAATHVRSQVTRPLTNAELQLSSERAFALLYLADPTHVRLLEFVNQEPKTDTAIRRFNAAAAFVAPKSSTGEQRALRVLLRKLSELRDLRGTIVSQEVSRAEAATAYGAIISGGNNVIIQSILPLLDTPGAVQANNLVVMEESLEAGAEERDLFSSDLVSHTYPGSDRRLVTQLIILRRQTWDEAEASLDHTYRKYFGRDISINTSATLTGFENEILTKPNSAMQIPDSAWLSAGDAYASGFKKALTAAGLVIRNEAVSKARSLVLRLILAGGLGLLAIAAALSFAVFISRALLRQFDELRTSAFNLTSVRLPAILARLRSGSEVDLAIETPQLEADSSEIGQLREAINQAAQTAINAAVDEVAMRRGVNDVFRNLARRNQSLLTRQLELLDAMERRVHDPEELADLFRVDHLTTRMRRHAEGLLIVAGGTSGRSWRDPVPIMDVMRAAVAEVEDYTRIRVSSRSMASIAGHAVADVIHMLAELVENAATFSPANTPVRVESDIVAKGLVIEIEDRGLGMGEELLAAVNIRLNDPPPLDLSGSEQLGLFIAGQLARRHDVKITMQASAYGGVTAVVLVPSALVVEAGLDASPMIGIRELGGRPVPQLPGRPQPEIAMAAGSPPREDSSPGYLVDLETAATAITTTAAHISTGPLTADPLEPLDPGPLGDDPVGAAEPDGEIPIRLSSFTASASASAEFVDQAGPNGEGFGARLGYPSLAEPVRAQEPVTPTLSLGPVTEIGLPPNQDAEPAEEQRAVTDFGPVDHSAGWPEAHVPMLPSRSTAGAGAAQGGASNWLNLPGSTPGDEDDSAEPHPGHRNGAAEQASIIDDLPRRGGAQSPQRPMQPPNLAFDPSDVFATAPGRDAGAPHFTDPLPKNSPVSNQTELEGLDELPIRVRQANLAPQLREPTIPAQASRFVAAPEMPADPAASHAPAGEPSPEAARNTMAALQRGWERGRSVAEQMPDEPDGEQQ